MGLRAFCGKPQGIISGEFILEKTFGFIQWACGEPLPLVAENAEIASTALTQVKSIIRTLYSNPASHGGATVATVLNDPQLRQEGKMN